MLKNLTAATIAATLAVIAAPANAMDPAAAVTGFLRDVWQDRNPDSVDHYVADDFVITSGGTDIRSREDFKKWVASFQSKIGDLKLDILETFESADGTRVVTRLRVTGTNNGMFGLPANQRPFTMTATAIWEVRADGKLTHNWVERNAWEVYSALRKE